jgi:hypothetical protein
MSPGARTIPAAMVLPMAAEIPNHIPSTRSRRPRVAPATLATESVPLTSEPGVEDMRDVLDNGPKLANHSRTVAIINAAVENAS